MQAELKEFVTDFPSDALPVVMDVVLRRGNVTKKRAALAISNVVLYAEGQIIPDDQAPVVFGRTMAAKPTPSDEDFEAACHQVQAAHAQGAAMAAPQEGGAWLLILLKLVPLLINLFG